MDSLYTSRSFNLSILHCRPFKVRISDETEPVIFIIFIGVTLPKTPFRPERCPYEGYLSTTKILSLTEK